MNICVISDTHTMHNRLKIEEDKIDMIIHCGDFSNGDFYTTQSFLKWFNKLKITYKILISGNHDKWFELKSKTFIKKYLKEEFKSIIYLEDDYVIINNIKIYGTPYVPNFYDWSFMKSDEDLKEIYKKIPKDVNILITHGPQYGVLDYTYDNKNPGSLSLKKRIEKLKKLKYHLVGHIHEGYGIKNDKKYKTINSAIYDYYKYFLNKPIIFEY